MLMCKLFCSMREDVRNVYQNDPAASNLLEVLFCYPGLQALWCYRIAHLLYIWKIPFLPRFMMYLTRMLTGIDIHPAAVIGRRVFIDHGMGLVIGETTQIGDDVLLYQQVTLGGIGCKQGKRHPTIGNHVIIGAGAKVLGNITIHDYVRIGAGSVVVKEVPAHSTIVGVPGRIVRQSNRNPEGVLMHNRIPDPIEKELKELKKELQEMKEQLKNPPQENKNI